MARTYRVTAHPLPTPAARYVLLDPLRRAGPRTAKSATRAVPFNLSRECPSAPLARCVGLASPSPNLAQRRRTPHAISAPPARRRWVANPLAPRVTNKANTALPAMRSALPPDLVIPSPSRTGTERPPARAVFTRPAPWTIASPVRATASSPPHREARVAPMRHPGTSRT